MRKCLATYPWPVTGSLKRVKSRPMVFLTFMKTERVLALFTISTYAALTTLDMMQIEKRGS